MNQPHQFQFADTHYLLLRPFHGALRSMFISYGVLCNRYRTPIQVNALFCYVHYELKLTFSCDLCECILFLYVLLLHCEVYQTIIFLLPRLGNNMS